MSNGIKKKRSRLSMIITFALLAYAAYQYLLAPPPACDDSAVKDTLFEMFQKEAATPTDTLNSDSVSGLLELSFSDGKRSCEGQLSLAEHTAPFAYEVTWQERWTQRFLVSLLPPAKDAPHAFYLLGDLPHCDADTVISVLHQLFDQTIAALNLEFEAFKEPQETRYTSQPEQRFCTTHLMTQTQGASADSPSHDEKIDYTLYWTEKRRSYFQVKWLKQDAKE